MRLMRERGFTLIEIVVVLIVLAILIAMAAALTRGVMAGQKRSLTVTRMQTVEAALMQYVMRHRRLPCPADGQIATGMPNAGEERRNAGTGVCNVAGPGGQQRGVVPWVSLGIAEADATDGWDRRFTYRVHTALVVDNIMDMSQCDPAGSADPTGPGLCASPCTATNVSACTSPSKYLGEGPLPDKGLAVKGVTGSNLMLPPDTGAAYVVISAGETGGGAYLGSGTRGDSTTSDGLEEAKNYADLDMQAYYVDDSLSEVPGTNHFDDIVSRPSVLSVITKAGLGPRSH